VLLVGGSFLRNMANSKTPTSKGQTQLTYNNKQCARWWYGKHRSRQLASETLPASFERLKPYFSLKCAPNSSDWLKAQKERGETFSRYRRKKSLNRLNKKRQTIYILPIGTFSNKQKSILQHTASVLHLFFSTPVKLLPIRRLTNTPGWAKRKRYHGHQLHTHYMLNKYLPKRIANNAIATIAFTSFDLWPGKGWNFVYGQADLSRRVGVWSLYRMGNPEGTKQEYLTAFRRTLKIAVHEIGHIFSITHCVAFECLMNGAMHMQEVDRSPLAMCPICLRKLCWNTRCQPAKRYTKLAKALRKIGLRREATFFSTLRSTYRRTPKK
jgi:archaemetzincin